jgi:hypothetical protein
MITFWAYWLGLGVAALFTVVMVLLTYTAKNSECRQLRWLLAVIVCVASLVAYGGFAFHQSYQLRDDGIHILFGRWWLYAVVVGFFAVNVLSGITSVTVNYYVAFLLALMHGLALLFLSYTPTNGGSYNEGPLILWLIGSIAAVLVLVLYFVIIALGWQWLWFFAEREHTEEGGARVQSRIWWVLAVLAMGVIMLLRCVLAALGPEGWNKYAGSSHNKETVQIWLTLALADFLMLLLNVIVYIFLDPSGDTNVANPFNVLSPPGAVAPQPHHNLTHHHEHDGEAALLAHAENAPAAAPSPDELMSQSTEARIARPLSIVVRPSGDRLRSAEQKRPAVQAQAQQQKQQTDAAVGFRL